ncbi:hypothetical protein F8M41_011519 [Gigaspora margarita]|uniref:Uncharacterized protein n=1 Tax=Gigaspora margarita TaxID=4874 RepID=A0A8H3WZ17_GIGMA|nr:hypothetical protein F8M41_011519 [Gigaspora margarita]
MSNSKNNHKQNQTKITSFISIVQSLQTSELFYENNDLFSEDLNFDNSDDVITTSEDLNNEQQKNLNIAIWLKKI